MTGEESELRRLVVWRLDDKRLSTRDVAKASGGRVSHGTVSDLVRGRHSGNVGNRVAEGLALGLDIPLSVVLRARQADLTIELPGSHRLSTRSRDLIREVNDVLVEAERLGLGAGDPEG